MDLQRTCPECNLAFEAAAPEGGLFTCPLCDARFAANPAVADAAPLAAPDPAVAPASSGKQLLTGAVAIAAVAFLVGGLIHGYHLFQNVGHKTAEPPPVALAPRPAPPPPAPVDVDPPPPVPKIKPQSEPPPVVRPRPKQPSPVAQPTVDPLWRRVNQAIDRGVAHLRQQGALFQEYRSYNGLVGLTLLECGVPRNDPIVQTIAKQLRSRQHTLDRTYELATGILFLDRLRGPGDSAVISTFARRLLAGQDEAGTWGYVCRERKPAGPALAAYQPRRPGSMPLHGPPPRPQRPPHPFARGDHSNTQLAILALWVAQRHGTWSPSALQQAAHSFRELQQADGSWTYTRTAAVWRDSNTCAGLLALAVERGLLAGQGGKARPKTMLWVHDEALSRGLRYLGQSVDRMAADKGLRPRMDAHGDLYFLWSLERVATIFNLPKVGSTAWYPWAAELLVNRQLADGSWRQGWGTPVDTCFALLILRRTNLTQDLLVAIPGITPRPSVPVAAPIAGTRPVSTPTRPPLGPLPEPIGPAVVPDNQGVAPRLQQNP